MNYINKYITIRLYIYHDLLYTKWFRLKSLLKITVLMAPAHQFKYLNCLSSAIDSFLSLIMI